MIKKDETLFVPRDSINELLFIESGEIEVFDFFEGQQFVIDRLP